jgi:hypothetical protein
MNNKELNDSIIAIIEKAELVARLEQNVKVLNFVRSLYNQGRMSDEVLHTFLLEFTMEIE